MPTDKQTDTVPERIWIQRFLDGERPSFGGWKKVLPEVEVGELIRPYDYLPYVREDTRSPVDPAGDPTRFLDRSFVWIENAGHSVRLIQRDQDDNDPRKGISIKWEDLSALRELITLALEDGPMVIGVDRSATTQRPENYTVCKACNGTGSGRGDVTYCGRCGGDGSHPADLSAVTPEQDQGTGWCLEKMFVGTVHYITVDQMLTWTADPLKALRLARRKDAEMLCEIVEDAEKVAEHEWVGPSPDPSTQATGGPQTQYAPDHSPASLPEESAASPTPTESEEARAAHPLSPSWEAVEVAEGLANPAIGKIKIPEWRAMVTEIAIALDAHSATLTRERDSLREALKGVPDPVDRVWCDSCRTSPLPIVSETVTTKDGKSYRRDYLKHDDSCWYGKVQAALATPEENQ